MIGCKNTVNVMKFIVDNTQRLGVALRVLSSLCGLGQTVTEAIAGLRAGANESEANLPLDELARRIIRREIDRDGVRIENLSKTA